jgi:translation elongation factor EF-Ts
MADTNKPPEILNKIISGQLRKFYEQICLTEQSHMVEEGNPKVGNFLKGLGLEVKNFKFMGTSK